MVSHYFCVNIHHILRLRERHCRPTWKTTSLEMCIYFPVVYLKEALSQKENTQRFAKQKDSESYLFFLNHQAKVTKAAKAGSVHRDAE